MDSPRVGVVVPTYNHVDTLAEAIESILAQSRSPDEILVVDDGSTDGTKRLVRGFGRRVRYLYQDNRGLSAARNTGIQASTADWVCFLDADDLWEPNKLKLQVEFIRTIDAAIGCVYTRYVIQAPSFRTLSPIPPNKGALTLPNLLRRNWIGVLTVAARRDLLLDLGGFDEDLYATQDWDLWLRMAAIDVQFAYLPQPLAIYKISEGSMHLDAERMEIDGTRMLSKFFTRVDLPFGPTRRNRLERLARAGFYVQLSWQCVATRQRERSLSYLWKALVAWPLVVLRIETLGVVVRLSLGTRLYSVVRDLRRRTGNRESS